jgi:apolipoprotein N-acyltransferase
MKPFLLNTAAILFGALLFAASFPNALFTNGLYILAWAAYIPVFWVINRAAAKSIAGSLAVSALWGTLYGYTAYLLFLPWMGAFHPLAGIFVSSLHMVYMALLFPLLKLAIIFFPKKGYILQWLLWLSYEYLKTTGFWGFPYGVTGYSQWQSPSIIAIASIFGVWGVSALVLFPSAYLGAMGSSPEMQKNRSFKGAFNFLCRERLAAAAWLGALAGALAFGFIQDDFSGNAALKNAGGYNGTAKIALIQQNADPTKDGAAEMTRTLAVLKSLSAGALQEEPGTQLVVWPETAVVHRIFWHLNYRDNAQSYAAVKSLLDFFADQKVPFLIGNDDARLEVSNTGQWDRVDYNAALLMEGGEIKAAYRKIHLVPFGEAFPFEKRFPRIAQALVDANSQFWKPGRDKLVFQTGNLRFSTPICFEDCFGYVSRDFTRNGAQFIVNLTNDSWAGNLSSQVQHLSVAVFRTVENRRTLVRAATSGQTCVIAPSGRVLAMAPPVTEAALNVEIPLVTARTPYTVWCDLWAWVFCVLALSLLLSGAIRSILRGVNTGWKQ